MIKWFKGQQRGPKGKKESAWMKIDYEFRDCLHKFKGAKLHVLLALMLHSNEDGICWPSYDTLEKETGYSRGAIGQALKDLCKTTLDEMPVLVRWREKDEGGLFTGGNFYLIFPTKEELSRIQKGKSPESKKRTVVKTDSGKSRLEPEPVFNQNQSLTRKRITKAANGKAAKSNGSSPKREKRETFNRGEAIGELRTLLYGDGNGIAPMPWVDYFEDEVKAETGIEFKVINIIAEWVNPGKGNHREPPSPEQVKRVLDWLKYRKETKKGFPTPPEYVGSMSDIRRFIFGYFNKIEAVGVASGH